MAIQRLFWKAYTAKERYAALEELELAISKFGFIVDFHFFSHLSVSMEVDISAGKMAELKMCLEGILSLEAELPINMAADTPVILLLNVSFAHGSGQKRYDVPAVPG